MKQLSSAELLTIWDEEMHHSLVRKGVRLVSETFSNGNHTAAARMSIGERNACLLHLREQMFGTRLLNVSNCPHCGETIEWESSTHVYKLQPIPTEVSEKTFEFRHDDYHIRFRLPDSYDIARAISQPENPGGPYALLQDCILELTYNGNKIAVDALPESVYEALNNKMEEADPQANILLTIQCPSCAQSSDRPFDILSFFWAEIQHWAVRLLQDIYLIARHFGWSEKDILAMSPQRRQTYIQIITS